MQQVFSLSHDYCEQEIDSCEIFPLAKQTRMPFPSSNTISIAIFDLLLMYVDPFMYLSLIVINCSWQLWMTIIGWLGFFLLKFKSDVVMVLREFIKLDFKQSCKTIKVMRSDNGTSFVNSKCEVFFKSHGILHQRSCVYTPQKMEWLRGNIDTFWS